MLSEYTDEELRGELKRRNSIKRELRDAVPRCRMCKHFGTINCYGEPIKERTFPYYTCCPFNRSKNGKFFKHNYPSQLACNYFERNK